MKRAITLAFSGASGAAYGIELLKQLRYHYQQIYLLISDAARVVFTTELELNLPVNHDKSTQLLAEKTHGGDGEIILCSKHNWMSPVASGSSAPQQMVICPCSTGTLASIAHGLSDNLMERAADVILKEKGQLILVPRESPLSSIHLRNMLTLAEMGAVIMPASPGFYHKPQSIDDCVRFMVARILSHLDIEQKLMAPWGYAQIMSNESI